MKIYIPSYNRAGMVRTHELFKKYDCKIIIPESQKTAYESEYGKEKIQTIPDERDGNIARKRNAILDIMREEEGYGIIVDDDMLHLKHIWTEEAIKGERIYHLFENLFEIARGIGAHYVGFNNSDDKLKYRGDFAPFSFTKAFYGMVGVIEDGTRYDESLTRGEDVDFYFKQMKKHHVVVRDNRYIPVDYAKNKNTGIGKSDNQCLEDWNRLQKRYGKKLVRLKEDGTMKGISQPYKGV